MNMGVLLLQIMKIYTMQEPSIIHTDVDVLSVKPKNIMKEPNASTDTEELSKRPNMAEICEFFGNGDRAPFAQSETKATLDSIGCNLVLNTDNTSFHKNRRLRHYTPVSMNEINDCIRFMQKSIHVFEKYPSIADLLNWKEIDSAPKNMSITFQETEYKIDDQWLKILIRMNHSFDTQRRMDLNFLKNITHRLMKMRDSMEDFCTNMFLNYINLFMISFGFQSGDLHDDIVFREYVLKQKDMACMGFPKQQTTTKLVISYILEISADKDNIQNLGRAIINDVPELAKIINSEKDKTISRLEKEIIQLRRELAHEKKVNRAQDQPILKTHQDVAKDSMEQVQGEKRHIQVEERECELSRPEKEQLEEILHEITKKIDGIMSGHREAHVILNDLEILLEDPSNSVQESPSSNEQNFSLKRDEKPEKNHGETSEEKDSDEDNVPYSINTVPISQMPTMDHQTCSSDNKIGYGLREYQNEQFPNDERAESQNYYDTLKSEVLRRHSPLSTQIGDNSPHKPGVDITDSSLTCLNTSFETKESSFQQSRNENIDSTHSQPSIVANSQPDSNEINDLRGSVDERNTQSLNSVKNVKSTGHSKYSSSKIDYISNKYIKTHGKATFNVLKTIKEEEEVPVEQLELVHLFSDEMKSIIYKITYAQRLLVEQLKIFLDHIYTFLIDVQEVEIEEPPVGYILEYIDNKTQFIPQYANLLSKHAHSMTKIISLCEKTFSSQVKLPLDLKENLERISKGVQIVKTSANDLNSLMGSDQNEFIQENISSNAWSSIIQTMCDAHSELSTHNSCLQDQLKELESKYEELQEIDLSVTECTQAERINNEATNETSNHIQIEQTTIFSTDDQNNVSVPDVVTPNNSECSDVDEEFSPSSEEVFSFNSEEEILLNSEEEFPIIELVTFFSQNVARYPIEKSEVDLLTKLRYMCIALQVSIRGSTFPDCRSFKTTILDDIREFILQKDQSRTARSIKRHLVSRVDKIVSYRSMLLDIMDRLLFTSDLYELIMEVSNLLSRVEKYLNGTILPNLIKIGSDIPEYTQNELRIVQNIRHFIYIFNPIDSQVPEDFQKKKKRPQEFQLETIDEY